jgi:septal ring factor EnvC (AmiA/AmiB activator)
MIAVAACFAYPILKRHDSSLAHFLHTQQTMDKIDGSLREQQGKLAEWTHDREQLQDQVARLCHEVQSRIEALRKETGQAGENMLHTVEAQIEHQIETIKGRLAAFKSSGDPDKSSDSHAAGAVRTSPRRGKRTVERGTPSGGEPER